MIEIAPPRNCTGCSPTSRRGCRRRQSRGVYRAAADRDRTAAIFDAAAGGVDAVGIGAAGGDSAAGHEHGTRLDEPIGRRAGAGCRSSRARGEDAVCVDGRAEIAVREDAAGVVADRRDLVDAGIDGAVAGRADEDAVAAEPASSVVLRLVSVRPSTRRSTPSVGVAVDEAALLPTTPGSSTMVRSWGTAGR